MGFDATIVAGFGILDGVGNPDPCVHLDAFLGTGERAGKWHPDGAHLIRSK
jgi:hypothetical protein